MAVFEGITGSAASEIAESIRAQVDRGDLGPGVALPSIRDLAEHLAVNRNTVAAAYAQLAGAGLVESRRRGGTVVLGVPLLEAEGVSSDAATTNLASGNPDRLLLPSLGRFLGGGYVPPLYGSSPVSENLGAWVERHMVPDVEGECDLVVTHGAVDAVERLLGAYLTRGDLVAVEDPCFLSSIGTLRLNGFRTAAVLVDAEGMVPGALEAALRAGARAVICTPRAQNPTGASITAGRSHSLSAILEAFPDVLVIEDDHFSAISDAPYRRITPASSRRWALVRSVSKFLGPDLRVALVLSDPETSRRLGARLSSATTWVSHILQNAVATMLADQGTIQLLGKARATYSRRSSRLISELRRHGIEVAGPADGLNVWIPLGGREPRVVDALRARGWAVRAGSAFSVSDHPIRAIRVTTAGMTEDEAARFANDLTGVLGTAAGNS
ncbi:aminotransferase class I/II-fold pyridoxal phosphate-dependent enzyme [Diaminobutyricibacter sp. McL0608]|uniref:aminotransferase class I/II-fold pyridoxal phosphate-dependent enzyme n=1 Tax=Leifsonia sp. McL0608 TaxID=3143537 RepID=UPI0031F2F28A